MQQETPILTLKPTSLECIPQYATKGSAGLDLTANINTPCIIHPGETIVIPTGLHMEAPKNCFGLLASRSGLSTKHGITIVNGVGVIDNDYRGEIKCPLINLSNKPYTINPGERIAQLIIMPYLHCHIHLTEKLSDTMRGDGGFGSTGK